MRREELRRFLIALYRDHIGVAAEFIVDDAFCALDETPGWRGHEQIQRAQFLAALERLTPAEVPFASMRTEINRQIAQTNFN
jgi:hypothetical protein